MFCELPAPSEPLIKAAKPPKGPKGPNLGTANGLPVIAIGKNGGKIVGWGAGHKPIYATSAAGKQLAQSKKDAASSDLQTQQIAVVKWLMSLDLMQAHEGKILGSQVRLTPKVAADLDFHFGIKGEVSSAGFHKFWLKDLLPHIGKAIQPPEGEESVWAAEIAAGADPHHDDQFPDPADLKQISISSEEAGSHGNLKFQDSKGREYLFKPQNPLISRAEEAASRLGQLVLGKELMQTARVVEVQGKTGALIPMEKGAILNVSHNHPPVNKLEKYAEQVAMHQVLDWLISNHDSHAGNFLDTGENLYAIDKGQAWKWIQKDSLQPDYKGTNPSYQIYRRFWNAIEDGLIDRAPVLKGIQKALDAVDKITDDQFKLIVQPYIQQASELPFIDADELLQKMLDRKHEMRDDFLEMVHSQLKDTAITFPQGASENWETMPESEPEPAAEAPAVTSAGAPPPAPEAPPQPVVETATPGWPKSVKGVTVHAPGGQPAASTKWPAGYPGPGYKSTVKYKKQFYSFEFLEVNNTMSVLVTFPDGQKKAYDSPNGAGDACQLFQKGLPLDMNATDKKKNKICYQFKKLAKLDQFEKDLQQATTGEPPPVPSASVEQLEQSGAVSKDTPQLTIADMLVKLPGFEMLGAKQFITDMAALPHKVQEAAKAMAGKWPSVDADMLGIPPGEVLVKRITDFEGVPRFVIRVGGVSPNGEPGWDSWLVEGDFVFAKGWVGGTIEELPDNLQEIAKEHAAAALAAHTPAPATESVAPKAEPTPEAKVEPPAVPPTHWNGPVQPGTKILVDKPDKMEPGKTIELKLTVNGPFSYTVEGGGETIQCGSITVAAFHGWALSQGYASAKDALAAGAKPSAMLKTGWEFWGLKVADEPPPAEPIPEEAADEPATPPLTAQQLDDYPAGTVITGVLVGESTTSTFEKKPSGTWRVLDDQGALSALFVAEELATNVKTVAAVKLPDDPVVDALNNLAGKEATLNALPVGTEITYTGAGVDATSQITVKKQPDDKWVSLGALDDPTATGSEPEVFADLLNTGAIKVVAVTEPEAVTSPATTLQPETLNTLPTGEQQKVLDALPVGTVLTVKKLHQFTGMYVEQKATKLKSGEWQVVNDTGSTEGPYTAYEYGDFGGNSKVTAIEQPTPVAEPTPAPTLPTAAEITELMEPEFSAALDALPVGTKIRVRWPAGEEDSNLVKQADGKWQEVDSGTIITTSSIAEYEGDIKELTPSPENFGTMPTAEDLNKLSTTELEAKIGELPVGAALDVKWNPLDTNVDESTVIKQPNGKWQEQGGENALLNHEEVAGSAQTILGVFAPGVAVQTAPAPAPQTAAMLPANAPEAIQEKFESVLANNAIWLAPEPKANNQILASKPSTWPIWVPPAGVLHEVEGYVGGVKQKLYWTQTQFGYKGDGAPGSELQFVVFDANANVVTKETWAANDPMAIKGLFSTLQVATKWTDQQKDDYQQSLTYPPGSTFESVNKALISGAPVAPPPAGAPVFGGTQTHTEAALEDAPIGTWFTYTDKNGKPILAYKHGETATVPEWVYRDLQDIDVTTITEQDVLKWVKAGDVGGLGDNQEAAEDGKPGTASKLHVPGKAPGEPAPAPAQPYGGNQTHTEVDLKNAPIGTWMTYTDSNGVPTIAKKTEDNYWQFTSIEDVFAKDKLPDLVTPQQVPFSYWSNLGYNSTAANDIKAGTASKLYLPGEPIAPTAAPAPDSGEFGPTSAEAIDALPVGTWFHYMDPYGETGTFTKIIGTGSHQWKWKAGAKEPVETGFQYGLESASTVATDINTTIKEGKTVYKNMAKPTPGELPGVAGMPSKQTLETAPAGSWIGGTDTSGMLGSYTKLPNGKWQWWGGEPEQAPDWNKVKATSLTGQTVAEIYDDMDTALPVTFHAASGDPLVAATATATTYIPTQQQMQDAPAGVWIAIVDSEGVSGSWTKGQGNDWFWHKSDPPVQHPNWETIGYGDPVKAAFEDIEKATNQVPHGFAPPTVTKTLSAKDYIKQSDLAVKYGDKLKVKKSAKAGHTNIILNDTSAAGKLGLNDLLMAAGIADKTIQPLATPKSNKWGWFFTVPTSALEATSEYTVSAQPSKPKPKKKKKTAAQKAAEAVQKAKAEAAAKTFAWLKDNPLQATSGPAGLTLAAVQQHLGVTPGTISAHQDPAGKSLHLIGMDETAVEALKKLAGEAGGLSEDSPLGVVQKIPLEGLNKLGLVQMPVEGPDGVSYPPGTTFTETPIVKSAQEVLTGHPGIAKIVEWKGEGEGLKAVKAQGTGDEQVETLKAAYAKAGIELDAEKVFKGSSYTIAPVPETALEKKVTVGTEVKPSIPDNAPPPFVPAPLPSAGIDADKDGQPGVNNYADMANIKAIQLGRFGHHIRFGKSNIFRHGQVNVRRVRASDGKVYYEVQGELTVPPGEYPGLTSGKVTLPSAFTGVGPTGYKYHKYDTQLDYHDELGDAPATVKGSQQGYVGNTDKGSSIGLITADGAAENTFIVRIEESQDVSAELAAAFEQMNLDVDLATGVPDDTDERMLLKAGVLQAMASIDNPKSKDALMHEDMLDELLQNYGATQYVDSARIVTTFCGHQSVVLDNADTIEKAGVSFAYTQVRAFGAALTIAQNTGWASMRNRYLNGVPTGDTSAAEDWNKGGARGTYTRMGKKNMNGQNWTNLGDDRPLILFPRSIYQRSDWNANSGDGYGRWSDANKTVSKKLESTETANEQMFEFGLSVKDAVGVVCLTYEDRETMLKVLTEQGITEVNGKPIGEFVQHIPGNSRSKIVEAFPELEG